MGILTTAPDWATIFGGVGTGVTDAITAILPLAVPVLVLLAGVTIGLATFRKFGVKR